MIIPYSEIQEILKDCYVNDGKKLRVKHSVYNGEREFAIAQIEMCMGLLSEEPINDKFIVQYLQGLLSLTNPESNHYEAFLNIVSEDDSLKEKALTGEKLSENEIAIVRELMQTNMAEYTMKGGVSTVLLYSYACFFSNSILYIGKKNWILC